MPHKKIHFQHGLGDCIHFARMLQVYKEEGWTFEITGDGNKEWIWRTAGLDYAGSGGGAGCAWGYPGSFENPNAPDWEANKIAHNINHDPIPTITGSKEELWRRVCKTKIDASPFVRQECRDEAKAFLDGLPHPIVALHSRGTTWTHRKDIPDLVTFDILRQMLDKGWSVVILDWDSRAPMVSHANCRSIIPSWCMIDPERECALFDEIDLMIGIDSGPFHVAAFTDVPALGVFREILPWRCSLPNRNAINLCNHKNGRSMKERSDLFNFWQYSGDLSATHIMQAAETILLADTYEIENIIGECDRYMGEYLYRRIGHDERTMVLGTQNNIEAGREKAEMDWRAYSIGGVTHILISGECGTICDLTEGDDGVFRGRWTQFECMEIELIPVQKVGSAA